MAGAVLAVCCQQPREAHGERLPQKRSRHGNDDAAKVNPSVIIDQAEVELVPLNPNHSV